MYCMGLHFDESTLELIKKKRERECGSENIIYISMPAGFNVARFLDLL